MAEIGRTPHSVDAREGGRRLLIIAGPTASGKSALAMALAARLGGTIINADAMQCYQELRVITARPSFTDEATLPHRLYGVRAAAQPANAAWWREAALGEMQNCEIPILCGGTGMYLSALIHGIAEIPDPGTAARLAAREALASLGAAAVHAMLDAPTAARLKPQDSQRVARAYEVLIGTGMGLAAWQNIPRSGLSGWQCRMILLDPPRERLRAAISVRFAAMLEAGAIPEVADFLATKPGPDLPLMRAHGVPEIAAFLRGEATLTEATARAVLATYQYTKRQATWFRHQKLVENENLRIINAENDFQTKFSESYIDDFINFINCDG
ncbi:MAG: tRNA (adenosine(37)-N6)-dimethylallyltransferase MiaA [Acidocella sp.]|nr:tRNA (adenosine(37)-N6)-dimethylallyltransferase MiaA [Acidocella sp.]